jgi:outer membrane protein OmpA-like peptidoglycan-associated protein
MPAGQRQLARTLLSVALLACGALLAPAVDRGDAQQGMLATSATLFAAPQFAVRFGRKQLRISGITASAEHEIALLQLARDQFAGAAISTEFSAAVSIPPDWETLSNRLLYLVAATESADALLDPDHIAIRGVSRDGPAFETRRALLGGAITAGQRLQSDVLIISNRAALDTLCRRNFASIATEPIRFAQSSTRVRQASYALLDRLAEFAYDCDTARIALVGHTDATGSAEWNVQVSRARAEAVAAELARRGVPRDHLIVEGRGAAEPIANNATVTGRERNRRIEIELR